jgi:Ca2+-binding EF-hand superfamily protein
MKKLKHTFFKTKPFVILSTSFISSLFCIQILQAQQLPQRGPIPFHIYDINSNDSISQDEFNTIRGLRMKSRNKQNNPMLNMASEPNFNQFDTDKNGQLNPDELALGQQMQRQKRWEMRKNQRMAMMQRQGQGMRDTCNLPKFTDFDKDQDGLLTPEEFTSGMQQHMNNRQNMRQNQGRNMRQGRNMPSFDDFDANRNGYISEQELIKARSMRISNRIQQGYKMKNTANIVPLQKIDTNSDGKISPQEFSAQQKQHQMGRQRAQ